MQRKDFIKTCCIACVSGTAIASLLQSCGSTNYFALTSFANNQVTIKKTEFVKAGRGKSRLRKYVLVKTDKLSFPVCVYRINEENYSALLMECTHKGCELQPNGNYLVCPCHGSEFTNDGIVQNPPAEENLKTFKTTTDNDNIYIQL